jgi:hypothetical protein
VPDADAERVGERGTLDRGDAATHRAADARTDPAAHARTDPAAHAGAVGTRERGALGVVPTHVVDSTRALVLRLGCLTPTEEVRALACLILDRG